MPELSDDDRRTGHRIQQARLAVGIANASRFARLIEVQPNTVYRYERGEQIPQSDVLLRIARTTGRAMEWFLTGQSRAISDALQQWRQTHFGGTATDDDVAWMQSVPMEGFHPSHRFFDMLLMARRLGLSEHEASRAAGVTALAREDQRRH